MLKYNEQKNTILSNFYYTSFILIGGTSIVLLSLIVYVLLIDLKEYKSPEGIIAIIFILVTFCTPVIIVTKLLYKRIIATRYTPLIVLNINNGIRSYDELSKLLNMDERQLLQILHFLITKKFIIGISLSSVHRAIYLNDEPEDNIPNISTVSFTCNFCGANNTVEKIKHSISYKCAYCNSSQNIK